jgi:hypothetical protein
MRAVEIFIIILVVILAGIIARPFVEPVVNSMLNPPREKFCGDMTVSDITQSGLPGQYSHKATAHLAGSSTIQVHLSSRMKSVIEGSGGKVNDCIVYVKEDPKEPAYPVLSKDTAGPPFD